MSYLSDRYGTRERRPRLWWVVAAVGISIGVAWSAWVAFQPREVSAQVFGYNVISDSETVVSIDVVRHVDRAVQCTVYVLAKDHSNVGERSVVIDATSPLQTRVDVDVQTQGRGVTGLLRGCQTLS